MEKLEKYSQLIQSLLLEYSKIRPSYGEIEVQTVFDTERHHYQVVHVGWNQDEAIHFCPVHFDIKNEKIWLQWNATEWDFGEELVKLGVPAQDIVIGFHSPSLRKYTPYAIA